MSRTTSGLGQRCRSRIVLSLMAGLFSMAVAMPAMAQQGGGPTPPDTTVCNGKTACEGAKDFCDKEGFKVKLESFEPAPPGTSGKAKYTYLICEPPAGTCSVSGASCLDNSQCGTEGGTCNRECVVDKFHGLSHFDVDFPVLADTSCLSGTNEVSGTCVAVDNTSSNGHTASVGSFTTSDGSCDPNFCNITRTGTCVAQAKVCKALLQAALETKTVDRVLLVSLPSCAPTITLRPASRMAIAPSGAAI